MSVFFEVLADIFDIVAESLDILRRHDVVDVSDLVRCDDVDHAQPLEGLKQDESVERKGHQVNQHVAHYLYPRLLVACACRSGLRNEGGLVFGSQNELEAGGNHKKGNQNQHYLRVEQQKIRKDAVSAIAFHFIEVAIKSHNLSSLLKTCFKEVENE